jgi:hypothetical protein
MAVGTLVRNGRGVGGGVLDFVRLARCTLETGVASEVSKSSLGTGVVAEEAEVAKASVASVRSLETGVASAEEL